MRFLSASRSISVNFYTEGGDALELDEEGKKLVERLGATINSAIEKSSEVADAIASLRDAGYEMELTLKLEIGLRHEDESPDGSQTDPLAEDFDFEFTDEDRRTLRNMRISLDENE
ncbi:MAG: hypothetical protein NVSMB56_08890 [Pyrinomonadaceae bacterium]